VGATKHSVAEASFLDRGGKEYSGFNFEDFLASIQN
jgi:hypothetical protein